jgi:uncharacterized RDD family membrane protein YckC
MSEQAGGTPPGWYPDPHGGAGQRYWDGLQWTDHVAPAQEFPPGPAARVGQPAGAAIRFGARFLDGLIVSVPLIIVLNVVGAAPAATTASQLAWGLFSSVAYLAYFVLLEASSGQTLGKRILRLRTVGPDGGNPTQEQALKRNAWTLLGVIPILGGLATLAIAVWIAVSISRNGYGPHDEWGGGTRVVRAA